MPEYIRQILELWFSNRSRFLTKEDYDAMRDWFGEMYVDDGVPQPKR